MEDMFAGDLTKFGIIYSVTNANGYNLHFLLLNQIKNTNRLYNQPRHKANGLSWVTLEFHVSRNTEKPKTTEQIKQDQKAL
jgi:hypothetical protein